MCIKLLPILQSDYGGPDRNGVYHCPKCASSNFSQTQEVCGVQFASCKRCGLRVGIMVCSDQGGFLNTRAAHFLRNLMFEKFGDYDFPTTKSKLEMHRLAREAAERLRLCGDERVRFVDDVAQMWEQST